MLLVVVVGLLVARPFVLGEDPGMSSDLTDPSGLVLTMFWLIAAAAWGAWRVWSRQDNLYAGLVEAGLGAVVIVVFGTTYGVAAYQHPARLISWEWLALFLALFLVRQLTVPNEEQHGLTSALLASAVTLSALALYQAFYSLPHQRTQFPDKETLRKELMKEGMYYTKDDPFLAANFERLQYPYTFSTYSHPNSFAGVLALLLPALVGAAVLAYRSSLATWQKVLAAFFALVGCVALWTSHSRGALLAVGVVGVVLIAIVFRRTLWSHRLANSIGLAAVVAVVLGIYATGLFNTLTGKEATTATARTEYWSATWRMIQDRPWFGVGPGNFKEWYPRYMAETAGETIKDPHNFALEMWATSGVFALIALLGTLAAFFYYLIRWARAAVDVPAAVPEPPRKVEPLPTAAPKAPHKHGKAIKGVAPVPEPLMPTAWGSTDLPPVRWSFYFGGMFGLLLGFVLRATYLQRDQIMLEAIMAGVQSIIWLASFALFEQIAWPPRARALVLGGGVVALLLNLSVSGGIAFPSVATLLWVVVALALNSVAPKPLAFFVGNRLARILPLPFLLALPLIYLFMVLLPVSNSYSVMHSKLEIARVNGADSPPDLDPRMGSLLGRFLFKDVITPLEEVAAKEDTDNAVLDSDLARLWGRVWTCLAFVEQDKNLLAKQPKDFNITPDKAWDQALKYAATAQRLNPNGPDGYIAEYDLRKRFANYFTWDERAKFHKRNYPLSAALGPMFRLATEEEPDLWPTLIWDRSKPAEENSNFAKYKKEWRLGADILLKFEPNDPNNPRLQYEIAEALYKGEERKEVADEHAARALALDAAITHIARKLTDPQRRNLQRRLGQVPES